MRNKEATFGWIAAIEIHLDAWSPRRRREDYQKIAAYIDRLESWVQTGEERRLILVLKKSAKIAYSADSSVNLALEMMAVVRETLGNLAILQKT